MVLECLTKKLGKPMVNPRNPNLPWLVMLEILPKMVMVNMAVRSKESTLSQTPRLFLFVGHRERAAQWPKGRLGQWEPWPWWFSPVVCGICEVFSVCACVKMYIDIYTYKILQVLYPIVIWTSLMWVCLNMGDPRFYSNSILGSTVFHQGYPGIQAEVLIKRRQWVF